MGRNREEHFEAEGSRRHGHSTDVKNQRAQDRAASKTSKGVVGLRMDTWAGSGHLV